MRKILALSTALAALALLAFTGCNIPAPSPTTTTTVTTTTTQVPTTTTTLPTPVPAISWDHVVGMGNFVGLMPWFNPPNGIGNNAPKDVPTLVQQFSQAGGSLIQLQLMYEDGAVFVKGKGLQLDPAKVAYCQGYRDTCRRNGVCVTLVLFDHCSLKYPDKWAVSPLNARNGGPFTGSTDLYGGFGKVSQYISQVVPQLGGDNVAFEIINEGESSQFAGQVRDLLKSLGITRITTSGVNPGGLWRYSPHNCVSAGDVKAGTLPNTDGASWGIPNVQPVCRAIRATMGGGLVFDGATDAGKDWPGFLNALRPQ